MLSPPGPSPATTVARERRGKENFAQARTRALARNGLTEADISNMTDEAQRSILGGQIIFELCHSDWAKKQDEIENKLREQEDKADVASRRKMVMAENARAEFPYPPKRIRSLLRRRRRDIEDYSSNLYWLDMFGGSSKDSWRPSVDVRAVIASMTAEAIHKRAFYMVGESVRLTKISRRRRQTRFILDLPKYALIGVAVVVGLFLIGLGLDLLDYVHRAPTVVATRMALSRLWNWLFTDAGLVTALVTALLVIVFIKVRKRLARFTDGA